MVNESADFLPNLTRAFTQLDASTSISTAEFAEACSKVGGGLGCLGGGPWPHLDAGEGRLARRHPQSPPGAPGGYCP